MILKDKRILITGGGSGIGLATIGYFLKEGMKVVICGRNQEKLLAARKQYPEITFIQCDINRNEDVYIMSELIRSVGGIDILYNNAAVINEYQILKNVQMGTEMASQEILTNYLSIVRLVNLFLPELRKKKEAAIINTTSAVAYVPGAFIPTYSASKAALHSYTLSLRHQLKTLNTAVKVFELIPPTVDTEPTRNFIGKKIAPSLVAETLIKGLKANRYTIHVDVVKMLYLVQCISPATAFKIINPVR